MALRRLRPREGAGMSTRTKLILFIAAAYLGAIVAGAISTLLFNIARAAYLEHTMPAQTEAVQTPVEALLERLEEAKQYVELHQPSMRHRLRLAGMPDVPAFDPNAEVLSELRKALAAVYPMHPIELALLQ